MKDTFTSSYAVQPTASHVPSLAEASDAVSSHGVLKAHRFSDSVSKGFLMGP